MKTLGLFLIFCPWTAVIGLGIYLYRNRQKYAYRLNKLR